jgi:hypothetical protein
VRISTEKVSVFGKRIYKQYALILLKLYCGGEEKCTKAISLFRWLIFHPWPSPTYRRYALKVGRMFGWNNKNKNIQKQNNDERPVKMVRISENVYRFVWADE